ncbi:MAG: CPXCG motif-containing cysteine-rich protein [Rhodanobacteraceae bacterium]
MSDLVSASCPYCGEPIELFVDASAGSATYIEDCPVCCRPMQVQVHVTGDEVAIRLKTGDE